MRIQVTGSVTQRRSPLIVGVAKVRRHLTHGSVADHRSSVPYAESCPVALWGGGQVHHGLGQIELGLGQSHVFKRLGSRHRNHQRLGVGHADVFAGQHNEAPHDEASVFASLEHARQPIQTCIGIAAANALDERTDDVVMVISPVSQRTGAKRRLDMLKRHRMRMSERTGHLEGGEHLTPIAT